MKKAAPHTSSAARRKVDSSTPIIEKAASTAPAQALRVQNYWMECNQAGGARSSFTCAPPSGRKLRRLLRSLFSDAEAQAIARKMEGKA